MNNLISKMRKEWIKQDNKLKLYAKKKITFLACYHEGYKDGIEKCYKYIKEESIK